MSGAAAIRDVTRTLPIVILVTLLVGGRWRSPVALRARPAAPAARLGELVDPRRAPADPSRRADPREVRDLDRRFNAMVDELARTRARESELLANLRHDLRTPVTVIGGYATALADGTATGEAADRAAAAIAEEATRLERLVDELGAIERLADGQRTAPPRAARCRRDPRGRRRAVRREGGGGGVSLVSGVRTCRTAIDARVAADRVALDRILGNLVDNALAVVGPGG